jgi:uncharacterized OB-fold protein
MSDSIVLGSMRPPPQPDGASAPFFEGLLKEQLLLQACGACGTWQLGRWRCLRCASQDLPWKPASGRGVVHSVATVCAHGNPEFNEGKPYDIAVVQLDEGPQLYTNIVGTGTGAVEIGMPVRVVYSPLEGGVVVPVFAPRRLEGDR